MGNPFLVVSRILGLVDCSRENDYLLNTTSCVTMVTELNTKKEQADVPSTCSEFQQLALAGDI